MATIPGLIAFVEGLRNGEVYDESDNDELVENFAKFRGYWQPYVSVDHEQNNAWKALSFGDVSNARKGRVKIGKSGKWEPTNEAGPGTKSALILDCSDIPDEVAQLVNQGRLPRVSVEFFDHTAPFIGPDDKPVMTNVLKSVSLLGAQSEASKGMPRPKAVFSDRVGKKVTLPASANGRAKRFWSEPNMNLEQLKKILTDAGADVSQINDDGLAALLQMLTAAMGQQAAPPDQPAADATPVMGDDGKPVEPDADDKKAKMFADMPTLTKLVDAAVAKATSPLKAQLAKVESANKLATAAKIKQFRDDMTGVTNPAKAYMTPVQFKALEPLLTAADDATPKRFADGKGQGTALDEAIAGLRLAYATPVKQFGDKLQDAKLAVDGDRRAALLSMTPEGKEVLRRESAK